MGGEGLEGLGVHLGSRDRRWQAKRAGGSDEGEKNKYWEGGEMNNVCAAWESWFV